VWLSTAKWTCRVNLATLIDVGEFAKKKQKQKNKKKNIRNIHPSPHKYAHEYFEFEKLPWSCNFQFANCV
jgi:hypothetical protein